MGAPLGIKGKTQKIRGRCASGRQQHYKIPGQRTSERQKHYKIYGRRVSGHLLVSPGGSGPLGIKSILKCIKYLVGAPLGAKSITKYVVRVSLGAKSIIKYVVGAPLGTKNAIKYVVGGGVSGC